MALNSQDYWRAIVLYGLNTATYKTALARVLIRFAREGKQDVVMHDVAHSFFTEYCERLKQGRPQQVIPGRKTVLERIVADWNGGTLTEAQAVERVERQGFNDVVRRFHIVNGAEIERKFYLWDNARITHLTDDLLKLFERDEADILGAELGSRWDLLEAAFSTRLPSSTLDADEAFFFLRDGPRRTNITGTRSVLNGYQNGRCFYCGQRLTGDTEVDHVIPWSSVRHDQIWNLVLACQTCNQSKRALLPGLQALERLVRRNEYYIASNHPIKPRLIEQLGRTTGNRRDFIRSRYREAEMVKIHVWSTPRLHVPDDDPLESLALV